MSKRLYWLVMMASMVLMCGCESDSYSELNNGEAPPPSSNPTSTETAAPSDEENTQDTVVPASVEPPAPVSSGDAIDINSISWLGPNFAGAQVTAKLNSASMDGSYIYTNYEPYDWSSDGTVDAICCLFYERGGKLVGGKFDFWRNGGQSSKTLENVHGGYGGHSMPPRGSLVYTMIASLDGKQRSNIILVSWE